MKNLFKNKIFIAILVVALVAVGVYFFLNRDSGDDQPGDSQETTQNNDNNSGSNGPDGVGIDGDGNGDDDYENLPKYNLPKSDDPESQKDAPPPLLPGSTLDDQDEYEQRLKEWAEKWGDGEGVERLDSDGNPTGEYLSGEGDSIPFDERFASWRYSPGTSDVNQWPTTVFRKEMDEDAYGFTRAFLANPTDKKKWLPWVEDYYLRRDMPDKSDVYKDRDLKQLKIVGRGYSDAIYEMVFNDPKKIGGKTERIRFAVEMQGVNPSSWHVTRFIREAV